MTINFIKKIVFSNVARRSLLKPLSAVGTLCLAQNSLAAADVATSGLPSGPGIGQTLFALIFIIGVLLGLTWFLKRMGVSKLGAQNNFMKVISVANLGTREKIALVEIGDTWLVLGLTPSNIRTLHTLPKNSITFPGHADAALTFSKLLEKVKRSPSSSKLP